MKSEGLNVFLVCVVPNLQTKFKIPVETYLAMVLLVAEITKLVST